MLHRLSRALSPAATRLLSTSMRAVSPSTGLPSATPASASASASASPVQPPLPLPSRIQHATVCTMATSATQPPRSASEFLDFLNESPTPYHAVAASVRRLEAAGFERIRERDDWTATLKPGGKYYLTRNSSSVVAFAIGARWQPGNPVAIIGAHTDSCCLRVKPASRQEQAGFLQVGVETYGGGIWHSWFDRDLSVAGRLMVREEEDGTVQQRLVHVERPILRIPTLAIHLDRSSEFNPNKETELRPIAGLAAAALNQPVPVSVPAPADDENGAASAPLAPMGTRHHPALLAAVAAEAGIRPEQIVDFELVLYDTQKACFGGLQNELIFAARLDNLGMTFCSVMGLIGSVAGGPASLADESAIRLISCFDHEEIGSVSAQGANSNLLPAVLQRLAVVPAAAAGSSAAAPGTGDGSAAFARTCAQSFLVSADMAHSVHPNYTAKYEHNHYPLINKGCVLKINANQRYSTNSPGIVLLQETARAAGVPLQLFVVRNDSSCGSTIGPMLSAKLGIRTLDLGNPQLSMHSIRETGGVHDVEHSIKLFVAFFQQYSKLEAKILVD